MFAYNARPPLRILRRRRGEPQREQQEAPPAGARDLRGGRRCGTPRQASRRRSSPPSFCVITIVAERGRAGAARPVADEVAGREVGRRRSFARMLDVHEQRLAVGRLRDAGDLAVLRADEEAASSFARRAARRRRCRPPWSRRRRRCVMVFFAPSPTLPGHRGEQHAVGHVGVGAVVGLDPQEAAASLNQQPSGLEKSLPAVSPETLTLAAIRGRARAEQEDVPA